MRDRCVCVSNWAGCYDECLFFCFFLVHNFLSIIEYISIIPIPWYSECHQSNAQKSAIYVY